MSKLTYETMRKMVQENEGRKDHLYLDHLGNLTGGVGHHFKVGTYLPEKAIDALFDHDFWSTRKDFRDLKELGGIGDIGPVRDFVLIDMLFNMGLGKMLKFKKMLKALHFADFEKAADEIKDSLYYRQHEYAGPGKWHRAKRNAWMMQEGVLWDQGN